MSETRIEINQESIQDIQYERYNELMGKVAIMGYAVLDTLTVTTYEISKTPLTESMAKLAVLTSVIGVAPLILMAVYDKFKQTEAE
jgi:hypothetical protein